MLRFCLLSLLLTTSLCAERVAIIGGGAAGLCSAWLLEGEHDVTLFEARDRLGGHADSRDIWIDNKQLPVELGFEFFSESQHGHLLRLVRHLEVPLKPFTLVTTFYHVDGSDTLILPPFYNGVIEWESAQLDDLGRMLAMQKVIKAGEALIESGDTLPTLSEFLEGVNVGEYFKHKFLYPFLAAGWGIEAPLLADYSAYNSLKYVILGQEGSSYEWLEFSTGSQSYIKALTRDLERSIVKLGSEIERIEHCGCHYTIKEANGQESHFDQVIIATHANTAGQLIKGIDERKELSAQLSAVGYIDTLIAIHGDARFMPPDRNDWRVANVRYDGKNSALTAYKARPGFPPVFKSWITFDVRAAGDPGGEMPDPLYAWAHYKHAVTNRYYFETQNCVREHQGEAGLWFAGAWTYDNDSHESAVISAVKIAEQLAPNTERLKIIKGQDGA